MYRILAVFFLIATILPLSAKESDKAKKDNIQGIEGSVIDIHNKQVLTGVCIQLEGTGMETYTDLEGKFVFEDIPVGKYRLISSYISYKPTTVFVERAYEKGVIIPMESL